MPSKLSFLEQMNHTDPAKVAQLFKTVDVDGNGTIDFEEFLLLFKYKNSLGKSEKKSEDTRLFDMFDKDGTGFLSPSEWLLVMKRMGIEASESESRALFQIVDTNNDGKISVAEFAKYIGE